MDSFKRRGQSPWAGVEQALVILTVLQIVQLLGLLVIFLRYAHCGF